MEEIKNTVIEETTEGVANAIRNSKADFIKGATFGSIVTLATVAIFTFVKKKCTKKAAVVDSEAIEGTYTEVTEESDSED
jgi:DNA helicase TIP49 (TBP-interacting protein)